MTDDVDIYVTDGGSVVAYDSEGNPYEPYKTWLEDNQKIEASVQLLCTTLFYGEGADISHEEFRIVDGGDEEEECLPDMAEMVANELGFTGNELIEVSYDVTYHKAASLLRHQPYEDISFHGVPVRVGIIWKPDGNGGMVGRYGEDWDKPFEAALIQTIPAEKIRADKTIISDAVKALRASGRLKPDEAIHLRDEPDGGVSIVRGVA